ncbi:MAG: AMP-dependent synthetase [Ketobacter sp.]|nr:MAG: AMP-dependent synthetase [Ketobacter sp.]
MQGFPDFKNLVQMSSHRAAERHDDRVMTFLGDSGAPEGTESFAGLDEAARKIAAGLVAKGLSGRNLMLLYTPGLDYIRAFFGCMYAGCVPVPAYPPMGARDIDRLKRVVQDCDAGAILSSSMLLPMIEAWVANSNNGINLPCVATDALASTQDIAGFEAHDAEPGDVAFLQYTSGSTGHPKGVMVSHANLIANFQQIIWTFAHTSELEKVAPEYKMVIWLPPFHDMGLIGGVLTPVYAGINVTLMSPLTFLKNPYVWLKAITDVGAKVSGGPNFSYQYCVRKIKDEQLADLDLSTWRAAFNGAEPIQADSLKAFADKFGACGFDASAFLPCYGLAEATLFVAGTPAERGALVVDADLDQLGKGALKPADKAKTDTAPLVSSGVLAIETDVRIVDPKTQQECADGSVGEIWVNSPAVAQGYWNKPSFSDSVFRATIKGDSSGTTYMRTGDLGLLHDGELFVTGRIKELIIVAGRNHYPQDIEFSLQSSNPTFRKGCGAAFAVTEQGKEHLVILQEVATAAADQTDFQQLALAASRAVATRHGITPKSIVMIAPGTLPKTSSGKIQRSEAKKLYELGNFAPLHSWENKGSASARKAKTETEDRPFTDWQSELYFEMQSWVSDKLNVEPHHIDLDVTFSELGVDSIEAIDLVDRLQDRIERTIPATELMRYPTVKALIDHFAAELTDKDFKQEQKEEKEDLTKNTA